MSKLAAGERIFAESAALLSRLCVDSHLLGSMVTGDSLRITPLGYHVARTVATAVPNWVTFDGDPTAGRLPKSYTRVGIVDVDGEQFMNELEQNTDAVPAVAWALGNAVMVGEIPHHAIGRDGHDFSYGMRIGTGALHTAPALWSREDGAVWVPDGGFSEGGQYDSADSVPTSIRIY